MLRTATLFCAIVLASLARGQSSDHAKAISALEALKKATRDPQRDSLSAGIKKELRVLLEADDAFTADLNDLPMSRVDAPDGKFRLLTWNVGYNDGSCRFEGLLLVQDKRRRVLYELRDMTERITNPSSAISAPDNWYGALYYTVIPVKNGGKVWYTLLGWKGYSKVETRKVMEVLSFKGGTPQFGAPVFGEGKVRHAREVFGFNFETSMSLKWEAANQRIVLDHLSPMKPEFAGQGAFMGPDLSYDAYTWQKDHWAFQRDIDARQMDQNKPWHKPPKE